MCGFDDGSSRNGSALGLSCWRVLQLSSRGVMLSGATAFVKLLERFLGPGLLDLVAVIQVPDADPAALRALLVLGYARRLRFDFARGAAVVTHDRHFTLPA